MKQFLPFLTDSQGRSLDVENEVVVTRSLPDPLENSPDGWESNTIQFARNNEFRGLIKSYTTSLKFYLDGAKILRNAFYRKGMETVLFFIWLKLDQSFGGGMKYKGWYKGEPDFGTFKDEYDGVSVNITEGGFYKDLQANKAVVQEIPFDDDAVMLYMDGLILYSTINYSLPEVELTILPPFGFAFFDHNSVPFLLTKQDGQGYGLIFLSVNTLLYPHDPEDTIIETSDNWMVKNNGSIPITFPLTGHIDLKVTESHNAAISLYFRASNGTVYMITGLDTPIGNGNHTYPFSFSITLGPGEKLFSFRLTNGETRFIYTYMESTECIIKAATRAPANSILAYRAVDAGKKIVSRVSHGATLSSPLLDLDNNLLVTSGDSIRALPTAVYKSSLSDWHKSVDAVKCIALDVVNNNPVVYSRYDKFNKNSQIADLGSCSNWELEPASDYIYDSVNVGYPAKNADSNIDINGKQSFNNTFVWKLNTTRRQVNAYDAVSKYFADPYDIELIRLNLNGKDTTTGATDNSNFFIDAEPKADVSFIGTIHFYHSDNRLELTGDVSAISPFIIVGGKLLINGQTWTIKSIVDIDALDVIVEVNEYIAVSSDISGTATVTNLYQLRRLPYTTINGIPNDGTVFNIELSPRRILENHFRWLRSSFDHLDTNKLVFQTTEKNKNLETNDGAGNIINEKADIPVNIMGDRAYLPYYTSFDIKSPFNLLELMTANSGGKFDYTMNGIAMDGFPIEIKTQDAHLETQNYKLLMTANNDNERLINR